jgi:hypothetical protein
MPYKDPEVQKQKQREWYLQNKEYHKQYNLVYKEKDGVKLTRRLQAVKRHYNLDAEQYLQMILDQNNCCAICNKPETHKNRNGDVRPLNVDHCHSTGKVRALLCTHCNSMLGQAFDSIERLQKGIEYLKNHSEI